MHAVADRLRWIGGAGDDLVPAYYAAGVRAYTSSVSNVAPRLSLALHTNTRPRATAAALQPLMDLSCRSTRFERGAAGTRSA